MRQTRSSVPFPRFDAPCKSVHGMRISAGEGEYYVMAGSYWLPFSLIEQGLILSDRRHALATKSPTLLLTARSLMRAEPIIYSVISSPRLYNSHL